MRQKIRLVVIILILAALVVPLTAHAAVVGRFTLIKGQVDVLKGGKVPGIPAKVQDGVEPGDVIRTKSGRPWPSCHMADAACASIQALAARMVPPWTIRRFYQDRLLPGKNAGRV